jgi:hypothetical protein
MRLLLVVAGSGLGAAIAQPETVRIVSWNASPSLYEGLEGRLPDFRKVATDLSLDVLVLIEVAGAYEVRKIAQALGWPEYYAVVSNWQRLTTEVHSALERSGD